MATMQFTPDQIKQQNEVLRKFDASTLTETERKEAFRCHESKEAGLRRLISNTQFHGWDASPALHQLMVDAGLVGMTTPSLKAQAIGLGKDLVKMGFTTTKIRAKIERMFPSQADEMAAIMDRVLEFKESFFPACEQKEKPAPSFIQTIVDTAIRVINDKAEMEMDDRDFTIDVDAELWTPFADPIGTVTAKVYNRVKSSRVQASREFDIAPESPEVEFILETATVTVMNQRGETATNITAAVNALMAERIGEIIR